MACLTVLGRGGLDYSAAILGAALDADEIQIWTDVDGVLTVDPRIVKEARTLAELTYSEAAELAYFGAKVLHPKTMLPAIDLGIPISVRNTFNPAFAGTRIVAQAVNVGTVKALTVIRGLALITVAGRGMMGVPGIAARTFAAVAAQGANVLMISQASSEQSICFVLPGAGRRARRGGAGVRVRLGDPPPADRPRDAGSPRWSSWRWSVKGCAARRALRPSFPRAGERQVNVIAVAAGLLRGEHLPRAGRGGDGPAAVRYMHSAFGLAG